jgi:hypothetical protein
MEGELLPAMINFTIRSYFPEIWAAHRGDDLVLRPAGSTAVQDMYLDWFKEVSVTQSLTTVVFGTRDKVICPANLARPAFSAACVFPCVSHINSIAPTHRWSVGLLRQLPRGRASDSSMECLTRIT